MNKKQPLEEPSAQAERASAGRLQRLDRIVEILEMAAAAKDGVPLMDVVAGLGIPPATAHRMLAELRRLGLLDAVSGRDRHRLGERIRRMGQVEAESERLWGILASRSQDLCEQLGETVFLVRIQGRMISLVGYAQPQEHSALHPGYAFPVHASASGKLLWAHQPASKLRAELRRPMRRFQTKTLVDPAAVRAELERVRDQGFGVHDEEWDEGVFALSVPIFTEVGAPSFALGVMAIKSRLLAHTEQETVVEHLRKAADEAGLALHEVLIKPE